MNAIVSVDDGYDWDFAPDGLSRFGAYVDRRAHLFIDESEALTPVALAVALWTIASPPVMSPGYVRVRPTVEAVTCCHADEPNLLLAEVRLRVPWPPETTYLDAMAGWSSWTPTTDMDGISSRWSAPDEHRRAALLTSLLRVPIGAELLPAPSPFGALM